jgi:type I restriction enzyme S subunit
VSLKEVCAFITDGDWIESKDQSPEGIRLIQTGNVGIGEYLDKGDKARYISEETFNRLQCTEVFESDVLVSRLPDPVGRACMLPVMRGRAITAVDCSILRFDPHRFIAILLPYYTQSAAYYRQLDAFLTGASRSRISRKNLEAIEIPLPPLEVQKEIVAEIEGYQKVINGARAVLDHYRPHIPIHPDWPMVELGQISKFTQGTQIPVEEQRTECYEGCIRFIRIIDYTQQTSELRYIKDPGQKTHCDESDIIMVRYGAVGFVGRGIAGVFANNLFKIQFDSNKVNNNYGFYIFKTTHFQDFVKRITLQSSMPALSHKVVGEYAFPLPPLATQQAIVAEIEAEQTLVAANRELIARFEKKIQATLARIWGEDESSPTEA